MHAVRPYGEEKNGGVGNQVHHSRTEQDLSSKVRTTFHRSDDQLDVMSQPTHEAFKAAMHMIKYLYENRHQGICFNENGEKTLRVYYDSG